MSSLNALKKKKRGIESYVNIPRQNCSTRPGTRMVQRLPFRCGSGRQKTKYSPGNEDDGGKVRVRRDVPEPENFTLT